MLRDRGVDAQALQTWEGGRFLGAPDEALLIAANRAGRTLVSFDVSTLPGAALELRSQDGSHAGIILISSTTMAAENLDKICDSLEKIGNAYEADYLKNLIMFAQGPSRSR
jgi:hypothetical protein